jgi:hypothetical protein
MTAIPTSSTLMVVANMTSLRAAMPAAINTKPRSAQTKNAGGEGVSIPELLLWTVTSISVIFAAAACNLAHRLDHPIPLALRPSVKTLERIPLIIEPISGQNGLPPISLLARHGFLFPISVLDWRALARATFRPTGERSILLDMLARSREPEDKSATHAVSAGNSASSFANATRWSNRPRQA